ncbi:MAG: hypothetical protein KKF57_05045 [Firmicutes bacterium]|nr:hypothetical protein [Bacillota bacterium]
MNDTESKEITPIVVIGVLILIIFSLLFIMFNGGYDSFPLWVRQSIIAGITTLLGAFIGAYLAGKFAILSVNKQLAFMRNQKEIEDIDRNIRSVRIICYELMSLITYAKSLTTDLEGEPDFKSVKRVSKLMTENNQSFIALFRDTNLMTNISIENFYYVYPIPNIIHIFDSIDSTIQLTIFEDHADEVELIRQDISKHTMKLENIRDRILKEITE